MDHILEINFWEMLLRTTLAFIVLLILARILGKKQLSQLTFFHYITGITIGSIAAEIAAQVETPFIDGIISLIWWTILTYALSIIAMKSSKLRVIIDDSPTVIIKDGELSIQALKSARLNMDDLLMMLREQAIFSIQDVQYAILETNGQLSVLKKPAQLEATKQDVKADVSSPPHLPTEIIVDGKVVANSMEELNLTDEWLIKKLKKKGVDSVEQVFYAQLQPNGYLYLCIRGSKDQSEKHNSNN